MQSHGCALLPPLLLLLAQLVLDHRLHRTDADVDVAGYFVTTSSKLFVHGPLRRDFESRHDMLLGNHFLWISSTS